MQNNSGLILIISDSVAPVITFINPSPRTNSSPEFTWRSSEQADFECSLDRGPYERCGSGVTGRWSKDNIRDGSHVLSVSGKDTVENVGSPTAHSWIVGKFLLSFVIYLIFYLGYANLIPPEP
jgi:hypothetical protein